MIRHIPAVLATTVASAFFTVACTRATTSHSSLAPAVAAAAPTSEWHTLFDGKTTAEWRGYRSDSMPSGWQVVDGAWTRIGPASDIVTRERFANFELMLEWKIAPGGNSGIMYRVGEEDDAPYWSGPEMQVLDDARHPDGQSRLTSAGSCYGIYPSPAGVVKPADNSN